MESNSATTAPSSEDFQGLPTLNSDSKMPKRTQRLKLKTCTLKALSMPLGGKTRSMPNVMTYKISDHYNLMEKLGFGAYSQVRRGIHKRTEKVYAVKIAKGTTSCKLLKQEAELLQEISNQHIPEFIEFKQDPLTNKSYLVMEYVKGVALDQYVQENGVLSEEEAKVFLAQLIEAVKELHSQGIAHRDIKPQNILITGDKQVKLIDLNISKRMKDRSTSEDEAGKFKSVFFTQISSPMYAAPEIVSSDCYSESIDIWGIGAAFAEMLFGFSSQVLEVQGKRLFEIVDDIEANDAISEESVKTMKSMLSLTPDSRPNIYELVQQFTM
jgi:serine/threonine protein kinase